jgi:hypothetical protein
MPIPTFLVFVLFSKQLRLTRISHKVSTAAAQTGVDTRRATEGPAGVLDSTSRSPRERNAVDMPGCAAAVETL